MVNNLIQLLRLFKNNWLLRNSILYANLTTLLDKTLIHIEW